MECKREELEKRAMHTIFIPVHSNWAISSLSKKPEPDFALFQNIYKVYTLTLLKYAKQTQKTLELHKKQTSTARHLLQTWKTIGHTHKTWERSNLSGSTTLPTTTTFSKLQTPRKMLQELIQDQSSPVEICMITKERIPQFPKWFCAKE